MSVGQVKKILSSVLPSVIGVRSRRLVRLYGLSGSVGLHREQYRYYRVYGRGEGVRIGKQ